MAQTTVNPYEEIGAYIQTGLAAIITGLPTTPTIDQLVTAVYSYIAPIFYEPGGATPSTQVQLEIKQLARTCINSYVNHYVMGGQAGYNPSQFRFISMLIGNQFTSNLPIVSIANRIGDVEDNLTDNQLTVEEQTPLLITTSIGNNAFSYWKTLPSGWNSYYPASPENYMDIPYYVEAAMVGALSGYAATPAGMIEPSINFVTNKQVSALIGALTVTAGKVVFQWIPRIQHANTMAIGSGGIGGGTGGIGKVDLYYQPGGASGQGNGSTLAYPGYYDSVGGFHRYTDITAVVCATVAGESGWHNY